MEKLCPLEWCGGERWAVSGERWVHVVTDDSVLERSDFLSIARQFPSEVLLHLRGYRQSAARLIAIVQELPRLRVIVHDRVDVAMVTQAAGVHLGTRSLPVSRARDLLSPEKLIGYSAHTTHEASASDADFTLLGPIFSTTSHPDQLPLGAEALTAHRPPLTAHRLIAIGGITLANAKEAIRAGADGIATISAVWNAANPVQAAREFVKILHD